MVRNKRKKVYMALILLLVCIIAYNIGYRNAYYGTIEQYQEELTRTME